MKEKYSILRFGHRNNLACLRLPMVSFRVIGWWRETLLQRSVHRERTPSCRQEVDHWSQASSQLSPAISAPPRQRVPPQFNPGLGVVWQPVAENSGLYNPTIGRARKECSLLWRLIIGILGRVVISHSTYRNFCCWVSRKSIINGESMLAEDPNKSESK